MISEIVLEIIKTSIIVVMATFMHVGMAEKAAHESGLVMVRVEGGVHAGGH